MLLCHFEPYSLELFVLPPSHFHACLALEKWEESPDFRVKGSLKNALAASALNFHMALCNFGYADAISRAVESKTRLCHMMWLGCYPLRKADKLFRMSLSCGRSFLGKLLKMLLKSFTNGNQP